MNWTKKAVAILTTMVMLAVFMPIGLFEQNVHAADTIYVSSWEDIYNTRDGTGTIYNKNLVLTQDITLPVYIDVITYFSNSTFDGNGYIITFPNNAILEYESTSLKTHNGIGLFGRIHYSTFKNVMFKAQGDVHIGMDQTVNDTYHRYDPYNLYDFGLLFAGTIDSVITNVAIVGESASSTFHARMEGGQNIPMNVGLIAGVTGEDTEYNNIYIDMNMFAGIRSDDAFVYGGMVTGRVYQNTSGFTTKQAMFDNFQIQGSIATYSGRGSGAISGGVIGIIETFNKYDASDIYNVYLREGIVDVDTYSYDFDQGYIIPNYDWRTEGSSLRGAVIGNENEHYNSILTVSNVISKLNNYQDGTHNISQISKLPTVNSITTMAPFDENWVSTNNGSGLGDVTLKWLVNPDNEILNVTLADSTFEINSTNPIFADKDGAGIPSWTINAEMMLKGALGTIDTVGIASELEVADVSAATIYHREETLPVYYPGGDYSFGVEYSTENIGSYTPTVAWSIKGAEIAGVSIAGGVLTIADTVPEDTEIIIEAAIQISATITKQYTHTITTVAGDYVAGTISADKPVADNQGNTDNKTYSLVPSIVNETNVEFSTNNVDWGIVPAGGLDITAYVAGSATALYLRRVPVVDTDTYHSYAKSPVATYEINSSTATVTSISIKSTPVAQTAAQFASIKNYSVKGASADASTAKFTVQELFSSNPLRNNGIARGDIKVEVINNNKYSYGNTSFSSAGYTFIGVSGGAIVSPTIFPTTNINTQSGISIQHPVDGAVIYYTTDGTNPSSASNQFVKGNNIAVTSVPFVIKAVAYVGGVQGSVATLQVDEAQLANPPQPTIRTVGGTAYSPTSVYDRKDIIAFSAPTGYSYENGKGEIRYIVNPLPGQNALDHGTTYDATIPPTIPDVSVRTVTIQVAFIDTSVTDSTGGAKLALKSDIATYTINLNTTASSDIIANRSPTTHQLPETIVHLSLPDSELSQINAENVDALSYSESQAEDQKLKDLYDGSSVVVSINDENLTSDVSRYISYEYDVAYESILYVPEIRYSHSTGTPSKPLSTSLDNYSYAKRIVEETYISNEEGGSVLSEIEVSYTRPTDIVLRGDPLDNYTIFAMVKPTGSIGVLESEIATFEYTIADTVKPVTISPDSNDTSVVFNENTLISLDTDTSGAIIFYSVNGEARVTYNETTKQWEPATGTLRYEGYFRLGSSFHSTIINTVAVSPNNSLQPVENTFYLTVTALPKANPPSPALASGSTVVSGDTLRFINDPTLITGEIYYTLDSSEPDAEGYVDWVTNVNGGQEPDDKQVNGTYKYDENTGIIAAFNAGESVITIVAVARDASPLKTQSNSDPVRIQYFIQAADAPTSIPESTADDIPIVIPGTTILLFSRTSDAHIFYTTDGTEPKVTTTTTTDPVTGEKTTVYTPAVGSTTKLVGVDDPPEMPFGSQAFFTIRAKAVAEDYIESSESRLLFQPPAPVQPVSPSISHLIPVARNTPISFSSSTEGASIIYKVYDTLAQAQADAVDANGDPVMMNATNGTLYSDNAPFILNKDSVIRVVAEKDNVQSVEVFYEYTVAPQLSAPMLSIPNGSIIYPGAVISITGDANGELSYTTNGDDPKVAEAADLLYGSNYVVTADYGETVTVKVISSGQGYTPSDTQVYSYTICNEDDYLITTPTNDETILRGDLISLSTTITNGSIYYTTDNSSPTVGGIGGGSSVSIIADGNPGETFTVKAIVSADGATPGNVVVTTFRLSEKTPAPTASIPDEAITLDGAYVTLTASEGTIHFTTDGEDPTTSSAIYENPVAANKSMILKAIAIADGKEPSDIVSYVYTRAGDTAAPTFNVNGGSIEQNTSITLKSETDGAQIYYTTSGVSPDPNNLEKATLYGGEITVSTAVTIKAIAIAEGLHASPVASATFTVIEPPPPESDGDGSDLPTITSSDRLSSRRTYDNAEGGPLYEDTVFADEINNIVVSAPEGVIEEDAVLEITTFESSQKQRETVNELGYDISTLYDIEFKKDTAIAGVDGEFEIGLPIDSGYQNGTVVIYRINDDGTVTPFSVRRSGGIAYAIVDEPGVYTVGIPIQLDRSSGGLLGWLQNIWETLMMLL